MRSSKKPKSTRPKGSPTSSLPRTPSPCCRLTSTTLLGGSGSEGSFTPRCRSLTTSSVGSTRTYGSTSSSGSSTSVWSRLNVLFRWLIFLGSWQGKLCPPFSSSSFFFSCHAFDTRPLTRHLFASDQTPTRVIFFFLYVSEMFLLLPSRVADPLELTLLLSFSSYCSPTPGTPPYRAHNIFPNLTCVLNALFLLASPTKAYPQLSSILGRRAQRRLPLPRQCRTRQHYKVSFLIVSLMT
jgi:hypothetical protein